MLQDTKNKLTLSVLQRMQDQGAPSSSTPEQDENMGNEQDQDMDKEDADQASPKYEYTDKGRESAEKRKSNEK